MGFDESIEEEHFSEDPIEESFEESKLNKKDTVKSNDQGSIVNMGSVIPNPKMVSFQMTNQ